MTAIPARRRRRSIIGAVIAVVLVALAAGLAAVGASTVINSTEGEAVARDTRPVVSLPATDNAALAVVDEDNRLTSLVVITVLPTGTGGSIVTIPVDADASVGFGDTRRPLNSIIDVQEPDAFFREVEATLAISLQFGEIVAGDRLAVLLDPLGPFDVDLPFDAGGAESVEAEAADSGAKLEAGAHRLDAAAIADLLQTNGGDPREAHANSVAAWSGVAATDAVVASPIPVDEFGRPRQSTTLDEVFGRAMRGAVQVRNIALQAGSESTEGDGVILDRRDVTLVFAQISPALVSTPSPGPVFRVEIPLTDAQIADGSDLFATRTELGLTVLQDLFFLEANVQSFDSTPSADGARTVTRIEVASQRFLETMRQIGPVAFGEAEIVLADELIDGVDVVLTLGTAYLGVKESNAAAPSADDAATVDADG